MRRALLLLLLAACAHQGNSKYPPLPQGCPVEIFHNAPSIPTDNIGTVRARCGFDIAPEACIRELSDQACKLGANVVWGVSDTPRNVGTGNEWNGRAAHTK
jgi:hypothetical protein